MINNQIKWDTLQVTIKPIEEKRMDTQIRTIRMEVKGCRDGSKVCPYLGTRHFGFSYVCFHPEIKDREFDPQGGFPDFCPLPLKAELKPSKVDRENEMKKIDENEKAEISLLLEEADECGDLEERFYWAMQLEAVNRPGRRWVNCAVCGSGDADRCPQCYGRGGFWE